MPSRSSVRSLRRDQRGNVLMLFGFSILPLAFATGMGIDYARAERLQTKLNAAADAAALSAVGAFGSELAQSYGETYPTLAARQMFWMQAQSLTGNPGLVIDATQPTITPSTNAKGARVYTVSYVAKSKNEFATLLGMPTLNIRGTSQATALLPTYIDIHVALDTSQSMGLAATDADAQKLYQVTPNYNSHACTFGCHVISSDDPSATEANDKIASDNGVTLRIDVLRQAMQNMIQTASDDEAGQSKKLYRFGLYRIGQTTSTITPLTTDLTTDSSSAMTAINALTLGPNSAGGVGDSNLPDMISYVMPKITSHGDGSTQAKARAFFFIVTDGVNDITSSSICPSAMGQHCTRPLDQTTCQTYKDNNVVVGIVYTTYLPIQQNPASPGALDSRYTALVKSFSYPGYNSPNPSDNSQDIAPALQACASPGWYFQASDGPSIQAAMNKLFAQASQTALITK